MTTASLSFETGSFPLSKFYSTQAYDKFKHILIFSDLSFQSLGVLRTKEDIANNELIELRNNFTTPFTETICDFSKRLYSNSTDSGDPSGIENPITVATSIVLSTSDPEDWWTEEHLCLTGPAGDQIQLSLPDTVTNLDPLLFPNQFHLDNGEGFASGESYTVTPGAPGFIDILIEGVFPTLTPFSFLTFKVWGFAMATIDEWTDGSISPGSPKNVTIQLTSGSFSETVY